MKNVGLKWWTLLRVLGRSLLVQASWNFDRLQNLGFFYMILPGLRELYGDRLDAEVCRRHTDYFNTHPYLSPLVGAACLRLEARSLAGDDLPVDVTTFKRMVIAPFAAMGDALFWGALRPLAAVVALFFASQGSLWAPLAFLLLFNLPHLAVRVAGLLLGYVQDIRVIETIQRGRLPDLAIRLKEITVVLLGVLCAYLAFMGCEHQEIDAYWGGVVLPVIFLYAWLARRGMSSMFLVLLTTAGLLALAMLF
ncbi:MAG: PTS system mannose/fructose/sorbose family transporter subunit IID [Desulfuromonadales bacterium]|nr:PTS system mannose/fructose/sorbose family transporter subunit IID [Desulfuromonadales bacterium]